MVHSQVSSRTTAQRYDFSAIPPSYKKKNRHFLATNGKNTANATKAKANTSATATSTTLSDKYKNEKIKK